MTPARGPASTARHADDATRPPDMWAGLECTINRVGSRFRDQLMYAHHYERPEDVERIASLGVRAVRYPVLWERHADNEDAWVVTDRALDNLRRHGIDVIAGLVHHGSGPSHTDLLDPEFADGLASFARTVAQRYPWIRRFTPINEPLTTARFAALYGLWYPHRKSDRAFVTAIVNQAAAIQRAMSAIREIVPDAELIQTEDLGFIHSTPKLSYQARFENERRWLTFDLLTGRVKPGHRLWTYLRRSAGVSELLQSICETAADPAAQPAILGVNHYLTSERFLDDRTDFYPAWMYGGNGRHRYVDVEAVRVLQEGPLGPAELLRQTWERFHRPIAVTEVHLACTREQQMRWLHEVWNAAVDVRREGIDVVAVTAWSAFGAYDWKSLLTKDELAYESGLFDVRAPAPRETALVPMVRSLAAKGTYDHPALDAVSWWRRDDRILHPRIVRTHALPDLNNRLRSHSSSQRPILVTGGAGTLGRAIAMLANERGLPCVVRTRRDLDISDRDRVRSEMRSIRPWAVVNAAGWVRVDQAEDDVNGCMRANTIGAHTLAEECAAHEVAFVSFSSDLVFSGNVNRPYVESDDPAPLNVYGRSKFESEKRVLSSMPNALVVRTGAFFGDWDDWNFVSRSLATLHSGGTVHAPGDATVSPTYVSDLVHATLDLLIDGERGIWHLANVGAVSWVDLARLAARRARLDVTRIVQCDCCDIGWTAPRPVWSVLGSERATLLPMLDNAIARYIKSRAWERIARSLRPGGTVAGSNGLPSRAAHLQATT